jgi:hypothetical protein
VIYGLEKQFQVERKPVKAYIIEMVILYSSAETKGSRGYPLERGLISMRDLPLCSERISPVNTRYLVSSKGKRQGSERKPTKELVVISSSVRWEMLFSSDRN